ncbi:MAG: cytochrome c5 family protein [Gammaproteobacteria bacterium]|nr:MAG: cytochrome c5 family protein [Gammaproteobacteria bacterium]
MSDREFLKFFSGLIGALAALTVILIIVANVIGDKAKKAEVATADAKAVAERIKPVGELTVASANPVMNALIPAANAAGADAGKKTYDTACAACHGAGVAGAPKLGDKADWGARLAQGNDTLYTHAIKGFQGKKGFMPAKGGNAALKDDDVKAAVDFMVSKAK